MNSCATWRLNSMLWEWCLAMAFILRKPCYQVNFLGPNCPASGAHYNQGSKFNADLTDWRPGLAAGVGPRRWVGRDSETPRRAMKRRAPGCMEVEQDQ